MISPPLSILAGRAPSAPRSFSVVIPTYDRPRALGACLAALAAQDFPRDRFEVLVVDDGGAAALGPVVRAFQDRMAVRLLRQRNAGPGAARNAGAAAAQHELVAFLDDDCTPPPDWLSRLHAALAADPDVLLGGGSRNALPDNPYAAAGHLIRDVLDAHFNADPEHATFFPSENMALHRDRLLALGGFDPALRWAEDRELCRRWAARGGRLVRVSGAEVAHAHHMGLVGFCRQHFGYGRGAYAFHQRGRGLAGQVDLRFYLQCFLAPLRARPPRQALPMVALMGLWQLCNTAGFAFEAARFAVASLASRARPGRPPGT